MACLLHFGIKWKNLFGNSLVLAGGGLVAYPLAQLARLEEDRFAVAKCDFEKVRMLGCSL